MRFLFFVLLLLTAPAAAEDFYPLYAAGHYDEAMRQGSASNTAPGLAIAARAALADAAMKPAPCLACLEWAEDFARRSVAADAAYPDGHVWLAAALGLKGRIIGLFRARLANSPAEAKDNLDVALKDDPANPYAIAAMGGWHLEIVCADGNFLARRLYGAREEEGLLLFDRAVRAAPGNVAVRYQIALVLSGYDPSRFRTRIASELEAAIHDAPQTTYEKFIHGRASELLALLNANSPDAFAARVRLFQGYPS